MGLGACQLPDTDTLTEPARRGAVDLALMAGPGKEDLYVGHHHGEEEFVMVTGSDALNRV